MLRGPDPDLFRTKVYSARWYIDPLPGCDIAPATQDKWPAVSTIKKAWAKPFRKKLPTGELVPLDAFRAAEFAVDRIEAVNALDGDRAAAVTLIATSAGRWLQRAADRGSGVHTVMEDIADGVLVDSMLLPAEVEPFVPACRQFVEQYEPTFIASEFICFNRELGFAGTADGIVVVRYDGRQYVALCDYKSRGGDHGAYEEEVAQIGGYSLAEYIVVVGPDGNPRRMALPEIDSGLIVSLNANGCQPYPVDLEEAQAAFRSMLTSWHGHRDGQKAARKARQNPWVCGPKVEQQLEESLLAVGGGVTEDQAPTFTEQPDGYLVPTATDRSTVDVQINWDALNATGGATRSTPATTPAEPAPSGGSGGVVDQGAPEVAEGQGDPEVAEGAPAMSADELHAQRLDWLRGRVTKIVGHSPEAAAALAREWSAHDDVPTFKAGGPRDVDELQVVVDMCWTVEGEFGLSFPGEEPGVELVTKALRREGMLT